MVMPFTAMQSDCVVGVLLMWSCGGLKALYKWQIAAFAPARSFFRQWRCVTMSNSSDFLEGSSNFRETLFARKHSLTYLFFSANMSNVMRQKKNKNNKNILSFSSFFKVPLALTDFAWFGLHILSCVDKCLKELPNIGLHTTFWFNATCFLLHLLVKMFSFLSFYLESPTSWYCSAEYDHLKDKVPVKDKNQTGSQ